MNILDKRIEYSINLIRNAEKIALQYSEDGFHLAFSGGKDSQVLYELAKMAGVKFHAEMQLTTVDPPELMRFIRKHYPDVRLNIPEGGGNMYDLIKKKKQLPLMRSRYCCAVLKEQAGAGTVTLIGIRAAESSRRAKRNEVEVQGFKFSGSLDQFNIYQESQVTCVNGKDKVLISPIFKWSDADVWNFIRSRNIPYCELYDQGFYRIGCMFCPMSRPRTKRMEEIKYPGVVKKYKEAIQYCIDNYGYGNKYNMTADEIFECWSNNENFSEAVKRRGQLKINF